MKHTPIKPVQHLYTPVITERGIRTLSEDIERDDWEQWAKRKVYAFPTPRKINDKVRAEATPNHALLANWAKSYIRGFIHP